MLLLLYIDIVYCYYKKHWDLKSELEISGIGEPLMFDKVPSVTVKAMDGVGVINRGEFKKLISRFKYIYIFF